MRKINYDSVFGKRLLTVLFASILLSSFGVLSDGMFASAVSYTIDKTKSGLVASDPLNNQTETKQQVLSDTRYWNYYGTAVAEKNTPYDIYKDAQGLHIGEPGPDPTQFGDGSYSGYYAVSPHTNAVLVHAVLTATNQPVLHNDFQNQLEIMTTSGIVNYLDCAAITNTDGTYWTLVHGYGDAVEASHFDTLWVDTSANQPLTRDCTVITNGANYLKLYMDNVLVYSSNTLSLNMPAPFDYYLQTMNSYYNQMRYGVFKDYYATTDENIKITNNPSNAATVSLVDASGKQLASSSVTAGTATLDVGKYHFPISGTINVYDGSNNLIASSTESIYGGDAFSVNVSSGTQTAPQPPTNLSATAVSSSQINLSWNAPSNNGGSPITGYKINRSDDGGTTWITLVQNTQSTGTTYSDTGLSPSTTHSYRVFAINGVGTSPSSNTAIATTIAQVHTITRSQSGLVASDSLTNETKTQQQLFANQQYWKDGGDAIAENAPYEYSKDSQGLHIGVQAPANGTWAGMYSVTPNTNAMLFHSVVTTPVNFIPYQWYENGMYVQTAASQNVNYVTCVAATSQWGLDWIVVSTTGNVNQATQFNVLYADPSSNQPLTRDCTIITNGNNYLKVYLDGTLVYNNSTMNLQMPGPFNAFLEPQSSYPGQMLDGSYKDYYATTDENIKITNNPANAARVDLIGTSGTVIASSPVISGTGTINVGSYHFPLAGTIKVYDGSNNVIASTSSIVNIFGGDVYSVS